MAVNTGGTFFISLRMLSSSGSVLPGPLSEEGAEIWSRGRGRLGLESAAELRGNEDDLVLPVAGPLLSVRTVSDDEEFVDDWCCAEVELFPLFTSFEGARMAGGRTTRPLGGPWLNGAEDGFVVEAELETKLEAGKEFALGFDVASSSRPCS